MARIRSWDESSSTADGYLTFWTNNFDGVNNLTEKMRITPTGNVGIGTNAPSATVHIKGSGTTSATASLLVQNSAGANVFRVRDDGNIFCEGGGGLTSVGIIGTVYGLFGGASYTPSASLVCGGTTQGFLPPRMTGTQAEAISSPAEGLMVYSTDGSGVTITSKGWWGYDGSTWVQLN